MIATIIICVALACLFGLAIRHIVKSKGCECGGSKGQGGCTGCCSHCSHASEALKEKR